MGLSIGIQIGDQGVQSMLSLLQGRAKGMTPAFKNIGEYMIREREKLFKEEHAPDGTPWLSLAESTKDSIFRKIRKQKRRRDKACLVSTRSITNKKILTQDHHLRRTVYKAGADQVVVGPDKTSQAYARIHQLGGKAGRGRKVYIPARPHLGVNAENKKEFIEIIRDHLLSGVV